MTKYNLMSKVCSTKSDTRKNRKLYPDQTCAYQTVLASLDFRYCVDYDFQDNLIVPMLEQETSAGGESEA